MRRHWNKERVLFAFALLLFAWTALKLGLLLTHRSAPLSRPAVLAPTIHHGDPDLRRSLGPSSIDNALERGYPYPFGLREKLTPPPPKEKQDTEDGPGPDDGGKDAGNGDDDDLDDEDEDEDEGNGKGGVVEGEEQQNGEHGKRHTIDWSSQQLSRLSLVGVVRTDGSQPRTQAVLRNRESGQLLRLSVGDPVIDDLRLDTIADDSVTLVGAGGHRHVLRGRFGHEYGH